MSTRSLVGKMTGEGTFFGRYVHHDGYVTGVGKALYELYNGHFKKDMQVMLKVLLDDHPAGWSAIAFCDFKLKPGYVETMHAYPNWKKLGYGSWIDFHNHEAAYEQAMDRYRKSADYRRPKCYCHGSRHEEADDRCEDELSHADTEYAYVLAETDDGVVMYCCKPLKDFERWLEPVRIFRTFGVWGVFASVALDGPEPDWKRIADMLQYKGAANI